MPPFGLRSNWPGASLLSRSSITADTLPPSRLAPGQFERNECIAISETPHWTGDAHAMMGHCPKGQSRVNPKFSWFVLPVFPQGAFKKERDSHVRAVVGQNLGEHADKAVRAPPARFLNAPWFFPGHR